MNILFSTPTLTVSDIPTATQHLNVSYGESSSDFDAPIDDPTDISVPSWVLDSAPNGWLYVSASAYDADWAVLDYVSTSFDLWEGTRPSNDTPETAETITLDPTSGSFSGTTYHASVSGGVTYPNGNATPDSNGLVTEAETGPDVFYKFTPSVGGRYIFIGPAANFMGDGGAWLEDGGTTFKRFLELQAGTEYTVGVGCNMYDPDTYALLWGDFTISYYRVPFNMAGSIGLVDILSDGHYYGAAFSPEYGSVFTPDNVWNLYTVFQNTNAIRGLKLADGKTYGIYGNKADPSYYPLKFVGPAFKDRIWVYQLESSGGNTMLVLDSTTVTDSTLATLITSFTPESPARTQSAHNHFTCTVYGTNEGLGMYDQTRVIVRNSDGDILQTQILDIHSSGSAFVASSLDGSLLLYWTGMADTVGHGDYRDGRLHLINTADWSYSSAIDPTVVGAAFADLYPAQIAFDASVIDVPPTTAYMRSNTQKLFRISVSSPSSPAVTHVVDHPNVTGSDPRFDSMIYDYISNHLTLGTHTGSGYGIARALERYNVDDLAYIDSISPDYRYYSADTPPGPSGTTLIFTEMAIVWPPESGSFSSISSESSQSSGSSESASSVSGSSESSLSSNSSLSSLDSESSTSEGADSSESSSSSGADSSSLSSSSSESSSQSSGPPCWMPPEPTVITDSITRDSFSVKAPDDVPSYVMLQLQIKPDGEAAWQNAGEPVGASGVVPVDELEPCSWYWLRWLPIQ